MPRTEEANQRIREAQTARILDAAWNVYARKGVATTMADVTAEASVSYGLAYRYFPSKEVLFRALIEQRLRSASGYLDSIEGAAGPAVQLRTLITRLLEIRRDSPELSQLFRHVLADDGTPEDVRELALRHGQRMEGLLRRLIVQGQVAHEVMGGDPDQLVTAVIACLEGLSSMSTWNPERLREHFPTAEIIWRILEPRQHRSGRGR